MSRPLPARARLSTAVAAGAALLVTTLAGCGSTTSDGSADAGTDTGTGTAPDEAGYPVTVENCGHEVTLDAPPERVVSLNQGSTEILLSLGLADRMAGTATWTDPVLPGLEADNEGVARLADDAPSYEVLLEAEPDLVTASFSWILGEGGVTTRDELEDLGVPSYVAPSDCVGKDDGGDGDGSRESVLEMDAVHDEVTDLARLHGVEERGEQLVADLRARMREAVGSVDAEGVRTMFWFANAESPYLAGCCGGPGIVARELGLENVFDDTTDEWPQVNWETVAERDPEVIVLGDLTRRSQTAETAAAKIEYLRENPVTSKMTAVREGRFIEVSGAELNPSIRTVDLAESMAGGLVDLGLAEPTSAASR